MMTLHLETIHAPYREVDGKQQIGYIIDPSPTKCRKRFVESMGDFATWKQLKKEGWQIVPCELIASERDVYGDEYEY